MKSDGKEKWLSILRTLITAAGSFFAGKFLLGTAIDENLWVGITSALLAGISVAWGIIDKTANEEMIMSGVRSITVVLGPLLVGSGKVKEETWQFITLFITVVGPQLLGQLSSQKNQRIASGELPIADLKGVDEKKPNLITPTIIAKPYG